MLLNFQNATHSCHGVVLFCVFFFKNFLNTIYGQKDNLRGLYVCLFFVCLFGLFGSH